MSGEAYIHLDLENYHIQKGMLILTTPDMIMECTRCSTDLSVCGIAVKQHINISESIVMACPPKDAEQLLRMMYLLWDIASETPFRSDTVRQMAMAMISDVKYIKQESERMEAAATPSRSQLLFQQFKTLVSQHCDRQRNIPFYAGQLHVSPHHLSTVISQASGHSVMYWINRAVALRAKVLLKTTDLKVNQICYKVGIEDSLYFSRLFSKVMGMSPTKYKESLT
jgi:YesN/AraC family two-component response regulator